MLEWNEQTAENWIVDKFGMQVTMRHFASLLRQSRWSPRWPWLLRTNSAPIFSPPIRRRTIMIGNERNYGNSDVLVGFCIHIHTDISITLFQIEKKERKLFLIFYFFAGFWHPLQLLCSHLWTKMMAMVMVKCLPLSISLRGGFWRGLLLLLLLHPKLILRFLKTRFLTD